MSTNNELFKYTLVYPLLENVMQLKKKYICIYI